MQTQLFGLERSIITPLRYPGNKAKPAVEFAKRVPPDVKEVVSPFLGSAPFELLLTTRGIRVYGYDAFAPLVNFWDVLLRDSPELTAQVIQFLTSMSPSEIREYKRGRYEELDDDIQKAAMFLILTNLSWNGMGFRAPGMSRYYLDEHHQPRMDYPTTNYALIQYDKVRGFSNDLLEVAYGDFRTTLASHRTIFAYCDPPYPDVGGMYGDRRAFHEEFPHGELAEMLYERPSWLLSYNDCELVRELYPREDFHWEFLEWNQCSRRKQSRRGNDVLIRPKN